MFGLLKPCTHNAGKYGLAASDFQAQMCGLCLGLRDGHGQVARAATNTDAILLGMLTEAQQSEPAGRRTAGPCPARGMRRANVAAPGSPGVQLAATASLLLGATKIRDHIDDGDTGRLASRPLGRISDRWQARAQAAADRIGLDAAPLIVAVEAQPELELAAMRRTAARNGGPRPDLVAAQPDSRPAGPFSDLIATAGDSSVPDLEVLAALTRPTQICAAELFRHTAILAGRPENADALREVGWQFGRIAHLADAIEDLEADREHGRFNPLTATGTSTTEAYALLRESDSLLRAALLRTGLERAATVRWMLLDPLHSVVRRIGRATGALRTCATNSCDRHGTATSESVGAPHAQYGVEPPRTPFSRPGFWEGIGIGFTQYCTGYACCAEHTNPCTGEHKKSWLERNLHELCDCGCDGCSNCCSCDCGGNGDGGCCDCDCCDCDCCGGCDCGC
ncbi:DUF5685 family protein [Nocardia inohanensis]|uniref:DUF5685 family protein n=1 Tax=Nocardia inohanensis TaxID=209246 RepID=UPI00082CF605|nr:DUF5685 family protein [Nocardia inohanensis]